MTSALDQIGAIIDRFEGSQFTDDPSDHGGATKYGITHRLLSAYLGVSAGELCPVERVRNLTRDEAVHVGTEMIALRPGLYRIADDRLRLAALDLAFHSGPPRAIQLLQKVVQQRPVDGVFGPRTETTVNLANANATRDRLIAARIAFLGRLIERDHTQARFAAGWFTRVGAVLCSDGAAVIEKGDGWAI